MIMSSSFFFFFFYSFRQVIYSYKLHSQTRIIRVVVFVDSGKVKS